MQMIPPPTSCTRERALLRRVVLLQHRRGTRSYFMEEGGKGLNLCFQLWFVPYRSINASPSVLLRTYVGEEGEKSSVGVEFARITVFNYQLSISILACGFCLILGKG